MAEPVRARRLSDQEGQRLQQIVRRGKHGSIRVRRAMIIMASAAGTPAPAIARLVAADEDTVRDVVHLFNEKGLAALDPQWAGGRPRLISDENIEFIVTTATTRPAALGQPFTRWSLRKLAPTWLVMPRARYGSGGSGCGSSCTARQISFQRTRTWKESATRTRTPSWTGSSTSPPGSRAGASLSISSGRYRSGRPRQRLGPAEQARPPARPPITAPTGSGISTAATPSAMTSSGASPAAARAATTPWPR